ncbi:hypothetical protein CBR_g50153 [Chara braunii]|uniref:Uncharacterized protein n=1 Tax=Chara braunii TaxID=69332 RepID=A0A388M695_CHABU|nr:hypothetical protein CBR_g50153 [Chara braunii]|eukprot:GBG90060.1 hypothetical protein CBR_g50153 [Chara braunii]
MKEGMPIGWKWEKVGEPDWASRPPNTWVPPAPVEEKVQETPLQGHTDSTDWKMVGKKGGKGTWVQKQQTEPGPSTDNNKLPRATPGPAARQYIAEEKYTDGIVVQTQQPTASEQTQRSRTEVAIKTTPKQVGQERAEGQPEGGGEVGEMEVEPAPKQLGYDGAEGQQEGQEEAGGMEAESGPLGEERGTAERNAQAGPMMDINPFQAAFDSEPMEVDPLPVNVSTAPEGLDTEQKPEDGRREDAGHRWVPKGILGNLLDADGPGSHGVLSAGVENRDNGGVGGPGVGAGGGTGGGEGVGAGGGAGGAGGGRGGGTGARAGEAARGGGAGGRNGRRMKLWWSSSGRKKAARGKAQKEDREEEEEEVREKELEKEPEKEREKERKEERAEEGEEEREEEREEEEEEREEWQGKERQEAGRGSPGGGAGEGGGGDEKQDEGREKEREKEREEREEGEDGGGGGAGGGVGGGALGGALGGGGGAGGARQGAGGGA